MSGRAAIEDFFVVPAVAMLDRPMRAAELADVAGAAGVGLTAEVAADLLARATDLGLVRVAGYDEGATRYVATSLGERAAASLVAADPELRMGLAELERLRTELLATVGHELRTPLTAIRTSVGLLLDPALDPTADQRQQLLGTIARSADRMQRLLAELLDLARLRAGRVEMQHDTFDARDLVRDVADRRRADGGGARPAHRGPPSSGKRARRGRPAPTRAGPPEPGSERAEVLAERRGRRARRRRLQAGANARWTVTDHGPGIGAEDRERLFERFFVGASDRQGGTGIGLPTALAIAQAHGGTIEVESEVGRGSTFHLVVPRGDAR